MRSSGARSRSRRPGGIGAIRDVVEEALKGWLDRVEDAEDVEAAASAIAEYERDGGIDAADFFAKRVAEARARYDSSRG